MNTVIHIASDEWRYWKRTRLAVSVLIVGCLLTVASVLVNLAEIKHASHERAHLQEVAEARFLEQPDKHPHRMVHYGHYVFRAPVPLSIIDPGVDTYTGTSIFLEGHRQNSAMFAEQRQTGGMTRFSSLSPSFLIQVLAPLFIILIGYAGFAREKESGTMNIMVTQGVSPWTITAGKWLAVASASMLLLVPLLVVSFWSVAGGESISLVAHFFFGHLIYLLIWATLVTAVSASVHKNSTSFSVLIAIWIGFCILLPRIGSSAAVALEPSAGKLEADFEVLEELRKLGDGHNASDPAFAKLKSDLLARYDVSSVDELPVNFRGVVAQYSEAKLTKVLNKYAEKRMSEEAQQADLARQFGWASPAVAMRAFSMNTAGTSLETHHRFLREAEILRFDFVQALNKVHQDVLDYNTDINRYKSAETAKAARVDASNWDVLSSFDFKPETVSQRIHNSALYLWQLVFWLCISALALLVAIRRTVR